MKTRVRRQRGGAAHIPADRSPPSEGENNPDVVIFQIADGELGGPVAAPLEVAKTLIAAADRPQDPYDEPTPGDEPE